MKIQKQKFLKLQESLYDIFPITDISLNKKINLFYNEEQSINYSLCTDGNLEHIDTWIDKHPGDRDSFLEKCLPVKRYEFSVTDSNIVLLEKKYQNRIVRNLYIDEDKILEIMYNHIYQVYINSSENIGIRKMEKIKWKWKEL